jgi:hypothetical protein
VSAALILGAPHTLGGAVYAGSPESRSRVQAVLDAARGWEVEPFLAAVRAGEIALPPDPRDPSLFPRSLPWSWAVEAVVSKLLWPDAPGRPGAHLLQTRAEFRKRTGGHLGPQGEASLIAGHELTGVVTTRYDTLAEGLAGDFHYGGLPRPQSAQGADSWDYYNEPDPERNAVELDGNVPVCKLHGSINWQLDGGRVTIWRDMRVPSRDLGAAAIAVRLEPVWAAAEAVLATADHWIVAGAAPDALRPLLAATRPKSIAVHGADAARWEAIVRRHVRLGG